MDQVNRYFRELLRIISESKNLSTIDKNKFWLDLYESKKDVIATKKNECLPEILPLIFPDFLYDKTGASIGHLINYDSARFNISINDSDQCQINSIIPEMICEFNSHRNIRGKCQADHCWPHSLGGPTILENRILLCRYHNVAKSNSIINEFWKTYPIWLNSYLNRMCSLKHT